MAIHTRSFVAGGIVTAVALVFLGSCTRVFTLLLPMPGSPPLGAGIESVALDSATRDSLLRLAAGQAFDTSYGAGDRQRLMLGRYPAYTRHGPLVRIQPNAASHTVDTAALAAGYVVARWINYDSAPYAKLATAGMDTTYWFVDSIAAGGWRSRYVSTRRTGTMVVDTTLVIHPSDGPHARPSAAWVWLDEDEQGWVTCTVAGCCTSGKAAREMQ